MRTLVASELGGLTATRSPRSWLQGPRARRAAPPGAAQAPARALAALGRPSAGVVFRNAAGKPFSDNARLHEALADACEEIGLARMRLHDLRHNFAAHCAMSGGDAATLRELLGHSTLAVTQRYVHPSPAHLQPHVARVSFERKPEPVTAPEPATAATAGATKPGGPLRPALRK
jgi:integrase